MIPAWLARNARSIRKRGVDKDNIRDRGEKRRVRDIRTQGVSFVTTELERPRRRRKIASEWLRGSPRGSGNASGVQESSGKRGVNKGGIARNGQGELEVWQVNRESPENTCSNKRGPPPKLEKTKK